MPERIQLKRTKGWRMPPNTQKVDRTTRWGNPWTVEECGNAEEAVRRFRAAVIGFHSNGSFCPPQAAEGSTIGEIIAHAHELRGKNLACWCRIGAPCHADVLLELANR